MKDELSKPLTTGERRQFERDKETIRKHVAGFLEASIAIARIRDRRLYRETHDSFEEFVADEYGLTPGRIHQLIRASQVAIDLQKALETTGVPLVHGTDGEIPKISNERQARALAIAPPDERAAVWTKAVEVAGGEPTAKQIVEVIHVVDSKPASPPPRPSLQIMVNFADPVAAVERLHREIPSKLWRQFVAEIKRLY